MDILDEKWYQQLHKLRKDKELFWKNNWYSNYLKTIRKIKQKNKFK